MNKRKLLSSVFAAAILLSSILSTALPSAFSASDEVPRYPFVDVPDWAVSVVNTVYEKGIMNGSAETTFDPNATFTREQIAVTLYRMSGLSSNGTYEELGEIFSDADDISSWAVKEVKWAYENEITKGIEEGRKVIL